MGHTQTIDLTGRRSELWPFLNRVWNVLFSSNIIVIHDLFYNLALLCGCSFVSSSMTVLFNHYSNKLYHHQRKENSNENSKENSNENSSERKLTSGKRHADLLCYFNILNYPVRFGRCPFHLLSCGRVLLFFVLFVHYWV